VEVTMGRRGVTAEDVVRACVALRRQRRKVGPFNVRLELGTGSYATITRHLRKLAFVEVIDGRIVKPVRAARAMPASRPRR
jgi:hypothetical protein